MLDRLRNLLRRSPRELIAADAWPRLCDLLPLLSRYDPDDQERLRHLANAFARAKAIEGAGGLELTATHRALIAVQASLPVLNLGLDCYHGFYSVIVYPGGFLAPHEYVDEAGVVHVGERELSGESWEQGPVILSWEDAEDGARAVDVMGNVVIHEFAHKLDMLNGEVNGMPPLHKDMSRPEWTRVFTRAYEDFCERVDGGEWPLPVDEYAASDPGEFFAVASESFFVDPQPLQEDYPDVYRLLGQYYRQDPLGVQGRLSA
jgi:Mlc titration factor MtfA (ptsG expression regulator)